MDTTKKYIVWIDDLSKNYPSIRLAFFATSTEEALQKTKTWLKENAIHLRYYTMKIIDDFTKQLLLKVEFREPSDEVEIPAERFFQQSKKSRTFYVTIYHSDGLRFGSLEYKAETPEQALEKAKTYMAREWGGIEIYRAIVKEKRNPQVLLDRVVSQENDPTDEEKALEDERFQAFMRDWKAISNSLTKEAEVRKESLSNFFEEERNLFEEAETPAAPDEVENSDTKKIYRIEVYIGKYLFHVGSVVVATPEEAVQTAKRFMSTYDIHHDFRVKVLESKTDKVLLDVEIHGKSSNEEAETLKDISNATDLYHAANDLIQISKQLTKVANQLLTAK